MSVRRPKSWSQVWNESILTVEKVRCINVLVEKYELHPPRLGEMPYQSVLGQMCPFACGSNASHYFCSMPPDLCITKFYFSVIFIVKSKQTDFT